MKQYMCSAIITRLFKLVVAAFVLVFPAGYAFAAPCDIKNTPPIFIQHNQTASHCELCGYGYVTLIVSAPCVGASMSSMTVVENLRTSGLSCASGAPTPITYSVNGGGFISGFAPNVSDSIGGNQTAAAASHTSMRSVHYG
jgi:large repetitive protein